MREGREIASMAADRARGFAEDGKRAGAEQADGIARAIRRAAEELDQSSPALADIVRDAAGSLERAGRALRDRDIRDLAGGVEDFARRQPAAFLGMTAIAGFALARFLKSSAERDAMRRPDGMAHTTATGAPGWTPGAAETARPATMAAATLGGTAAMRSDIDPTRPLHGSGAAEDRPHQMGGPTMGKPLTGERMPGPGPASSGSTTGPGAGMGTAGATPRDRGPTSSAPGPDTGSRG
jgi:hypothetical protein